MLIKKYLLKQLWNFYRFGLFCSLTQPVNYKFNDCTNPFPGEAD